MKKIKLLSIAIIISVGCSSYIKAQTMSKPKIIYVYDALCSWCFGFSPAMAEIAKEYEGKIDIEVPN